MVTEDYGQTGTQHVGNWVIQGQSYCFFFFFNFSMNSLFMTSLLKILY